ncbi:ankyrin repeat domain-containing protein [Kineococcus xinjiangensis]|uniref:ankyrin repeat domain-containing protein n=1 Tax=Kineococcus xinjiangensis TaxID=512762 RepID=UPI001B80553A
MAPHELGAEELRLLQAAFDLARSGETARLAELLDAGLPVNLTNSGGDTLLILAAYHVHPETVRMLLERGADTARVNDKGQTALAAATFRRSREVVADLLAAGADPELGGRSAVAIATFFDLPEMLGQLRGDGGPAGGPSA